jgi:hypothetical protein
MPRKKKQDIKINNLASLEGLCQETYNDACLQIIDAQISINELKVNSNPVDVDDLTKIAKEKGGLLKVKDSAIRIKLELAKLQSEIIKNQGNIEAAVQERGHGQASLNDFKSIREMLKKDNDLNTDFE